MSNDKQPFTENVFRFQPRADKKPHPPKFTPLQYTSMSNYYHGANAMFNRPYKTPRRPPPSLRKDPHLLAIINRMTKLNLILLQGQNNLDLH